MPARSTARWPRHATRGAGVVSIVVGALVIAAYSLRWTPLTTVLPGAVPMAPATALGLILLGLALLFAQRSQAPHAGVFVKSAARVFTFLAGALALFHFYRRWRGSSEAIDQLWFFPTHGGAETVGLMSGMTAVNLILCALYLALALPPRLPALGQALAMTVACTAWLGLARYVFGGEPLLPFSNMAVHTAFSFLLLSAGLLCLRREGGIVQLLVSDSVGGSMARRLLPTVIFWPGIAGWLRLYGQRLGWYGTEAGVALLALIICLVLGAAIWLTASALDRTDRQRRLAEEKLRSQAFRLEKIREEERASIAREIHDVLAQDLTCLKVDLVWLAGNTVTKTEANIATRVSNAIAQVNTAISTVQRIATELRPVILDTLGLSAAIEWQAEEFAQRTGIPCHCAISGSVVGLDRDVSTALFRILQESLTNVARHAGATQVDVHLRADSDLLTLLIRDNGLGASVTALENPLALGLVGMRERAHAHGGRLNVVGVPGHGTTVTTEVPFTKTLPCPAS